MIIKVHYNNKSPYNINIKHQPKFQRLYGSLSVEQALELNKIAKQTCAFETTTQTGE